MIAEFSGKSFSNAKLETIATNLWGGTVTFREDSNKVGCWEKIYKQEHISAFKNHWQHLLEGFSYEQNSDWGIDNEHGKSNGY